MRIVAAFVLSIMVTLKGGDMKHFFIRLNESDISDGISINFLVKEGLSETGPGSQLQEAGNDIPDEDITRLYYKLLKIMGWTIASN